MEDKFEIVKISTCCNYEVRYNGFVGGIDYGWTCNCCDRKCYTKEIKKKIIFKQKTTNQPIGGMKDERFSL